MNNITIAGNVGRDSELRQVNTSAGAKSVLSFAVAVKSLKKDEQGKYISQWFDCSLWGDRADLLAQYIKKGSAVTVCGSVELEQYTNKDGSAGAKIKVSATNVTLQGGQPAQQQTPQPAQQPMQQPQTPRAAAPQYNQAPPVNHQAPKQQYNASEPPIDFEDDIPFAPLWLQCQRMLHCI